MPDSPGNIEEIHNSLRASLGQGRNKLDQDVVAASKRVLLHNIEYQPASSPYSVQQDALRAKYISLNPVASQGTMYGNRVLAQQPQQGSAQAISSASHDKNEDTLPSPKVVLYPEEKVKMEWARMTRIGAGLVNMGNTCFFNSTLQCLTYTAPLVNYCFSNDHREKCKRKDFCMMCEIQSHIRNALDCGGRSIKPHSILQKLRCIAKHMKWGRQEDAHEFLRFVVDHLQQACFNGETKLDRFSKETTVINQIFGGYLRSQVTCLQCQAKSNTFDPFMDLSLDIKGIGSVEDALLKFVKPETLEHENAYKCTKCKNKVRAQKRFSVQKAPNVLTLQLNRFDFNRHLSGKINRFIRYPEKINLRNYMSQRQGEAVLYHLYGVLVHSGHTSDHGHYYSYVKSPSKTWYCMNDSAVHQANSNTVFSADAYVLFYARINKGSNSTAQAAPINTHVKNSPYPAKGAFVGPVMPNHGKEAKVPIVNGIHGKPTSELGTPIMRQQQSGASSTFSPVVSNGPKIVPHATSASALPGAHNRISFPILTPLQRKQQQFQLQQQAVKDDGKRIVLQIKHGNSTTMEKSPDGKSKVVNGGGDQTASQPRLSGLVPYNDDSDSEQENGILSSSSSARSSNKCVSSKTQAELTSSPYKGNCINASGDYQHNHSEARKITFPFDNGRGASENLKAHAADSSPYFSLPHSHPSSKCDSNSLSSLKREHSANSYVKHSINSKTSNSHFSTESHHRRDSSMSSTPHASEPNQTDALTDSLAGSSAAGKGGVVALDLLPVVTCSSLYSTPTCTGKVKSSAGTWLVQPQDCAPSPRGSCSSTNSVNSTTEWTVESKDIASSCKLKTSKVEAENGCVGDSFSLTPFSLSEAYGQSKPACGNGRKEETDLRLKSFQSDSAECKKKSSGLARSERSITPVDISDKQALILSPTSSLTSEGGLRKGKKHKKKRRKEKEMKGGENFAHIQDDSSSRSDSSFKKKKKKHKHKKDKIDKNKRKHKRDDSSDSDSSQERPSKIKRRKHSRYDMDSSDSSSQRDKHKRVSSEDSHEEYEWVEKSIEPVESKGSGQKKSSKACVQNWNHHIQDDLARKKNDDQPRIKSSWDGSRTPKVARDLTGMSHSLGKNVLSWDGGKNHVDRELEDQISQKRHQWSEDYNEQIDAGKVKKIKKNKEDFNYSTNNPFQQYYTGKHSDKGKDGLTFSWSQDHSYHQHHDHHYHKRTQSHHWHSGSNRHSYKYNSNRLKPHINHY